MGIKILSMNKAMRMFVHQKIATDFSLKLIAILYGYNRDLPIEIVKYNGIRSEHIDYVWKEDQDSLQEYLLIKTELEYREKLLIRVKDESEEKEGTCRLAFCRLQYIDSGVGVVCVETVQSIDVFLGGLKYEGEE